MCCLVLRPWLEVPGIRGSSYEGVMESSSSRLSQMFRGSKKIVEALCQGGYLGVALGHVIIVHAIGAQIF